MNLPEDIHALVAKALFDKYSGYNWQEAQREAQRMIDFEKRIPDAR